MENIFKDKKILVTGGTGSIGSEIVRQLLKRGPKIVRILSNDEAGLFKLQQELVLESDETVRYLIGDVRDLERLKTAMEDIEIVFHAAALKHVPLCEYNPFEAINTNIIGTQNVIDAALYSGVDKCVFISTDKAVNPTSVMGATKLLGERIIILANAYRTNKTKFSVVRFGNVLNSSGSIIPVIIKQIEAGGPVTITDPDMTRFIITIEQAVNLVFDATSKSEGGEIFILKMPSVKLIDLFDVLIEEFAAKYGYAPEDIEKHIIGPRIREKHHEELIPEDELNYLKEDGDMFVVVYPIINPAKMPQSDTKFGKEMPKSNIQNYSSDTAKLLDKSEIRKLLQDINTKLL